MWSKYHWFESGSRASTSTDFVAGGETKHVSTVTAATVKLIIHVPHIRHILNLQNNVKLIFHMYEYKILASFIILLRYVELYIS